MSKDIVTDQLLVVVLNATTVQKIKKIRLSFDRFVCLWEAHVMSSSKRAATTFHSPLDDAGILLHVLNILGPGQHLLVSAVSKAWRDSYTRVASVQMAGITEDCDGIADLVTIGSQTTLFSAVFASAASVRLAHECGLAFDNKKLHHIAGRAANISALRAAREVGLQLTDDVLIGAAEAASVPKLKWLHTQQGSNELPEDICYWAAKSGSIDTLNWLRDHGSEFETFICERAASGAHQHLLQYLQDEGCEWDEQACSGAARNGHLNTLQWLHEQGCPWKSDKICGDAAESGSIEMLLYLRQQGCEYSEDTILGAAWTGQLAVCQYLVAEQCPCDAEACTVAAERGHLETVRFLHESGCPWEADTICTRAARSGNIELMQYLQQRGGAFSAQVMSAAVYGGHTQLCELLRGEQCPWDAQACRGAAYAGHVGTLRWLHEQGCPWDVHALRAVAAEEGHMSVLDFMQTVEPANAVQLTELLNLAGSCDHLDVAKWLRQQGAEWPAVLRFDGNSWVHVMVQWARGEGCTSPITDATTDATADA
jgi:hypothetical protein